jgi:hypothetical protein
MKTKPKNCIARGNEKQRKLISRLLKKLLEDLDTESWDYDICVDVVETSQFPDASNPA